MIKWGPVPPFFVYGLCLRLCVGRGFSSVVLCSMKTVRALDMSDHILLNIVSACLVACGKCDVEINEIRRKGLLCMPNKG